MTLDDALDCSKYSIARRIYDRVRYVEVSEIGKERAAYLTWRKGGWASPLPIGYDIKDMKDWEPRNE
jgi:hypothetical protein